MFSKLNKRLAIVYPLCIVGLMYKSDEYMTFDDISPKEARNQVERHGASWSEFLDEVGRKDLYTGDEVLGWLGY